MLVEQLLALVLDQLAVAIVMIRLQGRLPKWTGRLLIAQLYVVNRALLDLLEKERVGNRRSTLTRNDQQRDRHHTEDDQQRPDTGAGAAERRLGVPSRP